MKLAANDGFTERSIWGNPKLATEVVKDRLAQITIPTSSSGVAATNRLPRRRQGLRRRIPGAKLAIIPDCGHGPSIEKPRSSSTPSCPSSTRSS